MFDGVRPPWGDGANELWPRPGGWQTVQFRDDRWGVDELRALVAWSGAPACLAVVHDSDVAHLVGVAPEGREWEAVLGLDVAAELGIERPEDVIDDLAWIGSPRYAQEVAAERARLEAAVPAVAAAAIGWARVAGVAGTAGVAKAVEQGAVEQVLRSRAVLIEDSFIALLDALGFPSALASGGETEA